MWNLSDIAQVILLLSIKDAIILMILRIQPKIVEYDILNWSALSLIQKYILN